MQPITLLMGPLEVNTYIMPGTCAGKCFVVDPSDFALVRDAMAEHGLTPTHILLTHGHFDHILAVAALQKEFGAKVCIHGADAEALYSKRASLSLLAGMEVPPCRADMLLAGGEKTAVSEIARLCGFRDPLYFSRMFKKRYQVSPSRYAVMQREEAREMDSDSQKIIAPD